MPSGGQNSQSDVVVAHIGDVVTALWPTAAFTTNPILHTAPTANVLNPYSHDERKNYPDVALTNRVVFFRKHAVSRRVGFRSEEVTEEVLNMAIKPTECVCRCAGL